MSEQQAEQPPQQEQQPQVTEQQQTATELSQSQVIRDKLREYLDQGYDLTVKDTKVKVCNLVADELNPKYPHLERDSMYSAVTRQVKDVLKQKSKDEGKPSEVTRQIGGSDVKLRIPDRIADKQEEKKEEQQPQASLETKPAEPARPNYKAVYIAAKDENELKATPEYRFIKGQIDVGIGFVEQMYAKFGIAENLGDPKQLEFMKDATAQMAMKYNWQIPDKVEKLVIIGGWAMILGMPIADKVGLLGHIKDTISKDKPKDNTSKEPLAPIKKM